MNKQYFITGTDTEVGKTRMTSALLQVANAKGLSTLGLKPIASGCHFSDGQWHNDDALALQAAASIKLPYQQINPIALPQAIAPHLAAKAKGITLSVSLLQQHYQALLPMPADFTLIEGVGGWLVPLNTTETMADFVAAINIPVILVVGIRLGCINHALLTAQVIRENNLALAGWVANSIDPDAQEQGEIIATLMSRLDAPCIGCVPFLPTTPQDTNTQIDYSQWLKLHRLRN